MSRRHGSRHIAFDACKRIAIKKQGDPLLLDEFSRFVKHVHIIPAIIVERIDHQWRTQQKPDLRTAQARFQTSDAIRIKRIPLLHVNTVRANFLDGRTTGKQTEKQNGKQKTTHSQEAERDRAGG